jgi:hypothetical protein
MVGSRKVDAEWQLFAAVNNLLMLLMFQRSQHPVHMAATG